MKPRMKDRQQSSQASPIVKSKRPEGQATQAKPSAISEPKQKLKTKKRSLDATELAEASTTTKLKNSSSGGNGENANGVADKARLAETSGEKRRKVSEESVTVNGNGARKTVLAESEASVSVTKKTAATTSVLDKKKFKNATTSQAPLSTTKRLQNGTPNGVSNAPLNNKYKPTNQTNGASASQRPSQRLLDDKEKKIFQDRRKLPIWLSGPDIKYALRYKGDVMLLIGETGSGKSTQVPQFLMNEPWMVRKSVTVKGPDGEDKAVNVGGMIAITEPRRVAAVSLAQRVAVETGSYLGPHCNENDKVGYAVRFESNVPRNAKIKFLTEGMLLQELLRDPHLRKYSCVIVDEVHERSVDVDLLLGFLKNILTGDKSGRGGIPLKVVIMSATADVEKLRGFFTLPKTLPVPAGPKILTNGVNGHSRATPVKANGLVKKWIATTSPPPDGGVDADNAIEDGDDDEEHPMTGSRRLSTSSNSSIRSTYSSWSGLSDTIKEGDLAVGTVGELLTEELPRYGATDKTDGELEDALEDGKATATAPGDIFDLKGTNNTIVYHIAGRQHPVSMLYVPEPVMDVLEGCFRTIFIIHTTEPMPGDILVFLTGQDEIESLLARVTEQATHLVKQFPRLECTPLFGQLSIEKQQVAFARPVNKNARKVILATNIAETSITVPGVRYVIDTGKAKVKEYRPHLGLQSLLPKPISKSSATQRKGRAGREAPGKVWRLYTEQQYADLPETDRPEILRSDVVEAVLKMKARGIEDIFGFPLMDAPPRDTILKALSHLFDIGALDADGALNAVGRQMAMFPLSPSYARVVVAAAQPDADCLVEAIDAIAALSGDDIFEQPKSEEEREITEEARKDLLRREGDILTQLTAMQRYCRETESRKKWCQKHLVNARHMETALSVRRQLRQACVQAKLLSAGALADADAREFVPLAPERAETLLKCFLRAFVGRTAMLDKDGSYKTIRGKHTVQIHPSSVMHGRKREAIMYLEHVFTNKNYAKKCSGMQGDWIAEVMAGVDGI